MMFFCWVHIRFLTFLLYQWLALKISCLRLFIEVKEINASNFPVVYYRIIHFSPWQKDNKIACTEGKVASRDKSIRQTSNFTKSMQIRWINILHIMFALLKLSYVCDMKENNPQSRFARLWIVASVWCGWRRFVVLPATAYRALEAETTVR